MGLGRTADAIDSFERARAMDARRFAYDFELGLLYLDARRFAEARDALDRVPASHPEYPMVLFKRAQVSVLLNEPDSAARIAARAATRRRDDQDAHRAGAPVPAAAGWSIDEERARRLSSPGPLTIRQP